MKPILIAILSLFIFSCNQNSSTSGKELPDSTNSIDITDNTDIIGKWQMCSESVNGLMTQYNVCPSISFLKNGSGYIGNSSIIAEHFSWSLKKRSLNIFYKDKITNSTFPDTFYNAIIKKQNDLMNLVISQTKNDNIFYLSR